MTQFTPESPCRCGFDGAGAHRCHAGRADRHTGEDGARRCTADAVPTEIAVYRVGMFGAVGKPMGTTTAYYCAEHFKECFGLPIERAHEVKG